MKNVKKQSIAKLIIARLLRKLGNSIYRRSGDGQTVAARGQTSKGGLILHVGPKGFRPCLSSYMMMHNNRRLLPDRGGIPKAAHLRHGGIAFRILTWTHKWQLQSYRPSITHKGQFNNQHPRLNLPSPAFQSQAQKEAETCH